MCEKNKFFCLVAALVSLFSAGYANATVSGSARSAVAGNVAPGRAQGRQVERQIERQDTSRAGATVTARSTQRTVSNSSRSGATVSNARSAKNAVGARSGTNVVVAPAVRNNTSVARSGAPVGRSAVNVGRSAVGGNVAYSESRRMSRAAAVFDDVSKIGGGYSACRDSYATCMDQFCAKANETYRRCFCSERFLEFRDIEEALDESKILLQQFEDNSLNAVDKTAEEVDAMYSATIGEAAIKKDTSAAQKTLDAIGDLLSGKRKVEKTKNQSYSSGLMSLDFSFDSSDVFGGGSSTGGSIFGSGGGTDFSTLEGAELFKKAHEQCAVLAAEACSSEAVANLVKSSYSIMITQDCNLYQKNIDAKREGVMNTVRQAEKYLREARLEEYRSHNSADVNECLDKVRSAMFADTACGANYKRCLDYTGAYVNPATGEPNYTQRLFELTDLIRLDGVGGNTDVLSNNSKFDAFLDSKRMFASSALDTCRTIADTVWAEFKRTALIEIAQAQDEKIEAVKSSCVDTMKQCYDKQSGALKSFDDTTAQASGALSAYAAREMCQDKVAACASLYGDTDGCTFDGNGKVLTTNANGRCGLDALLKFVDTVDTVRIGEGCYAGIDNFLKQQCASPDENYEYPWGCKSVRAGSLDNVTVEDGKFVVVDTEHGQSGEDSKKRSTLAGMIVNYVNTFCPVSDETMGDLQDRNLREMRRIFDETVAKMSLLLQPICEDIGGVWTAGGEELNKLAEKFGSDVGESGMLNDEFHKIVYAGDKTMGISEYGVCLKNDVQMQCDIQNVDTDNQGFATYDAATNTCNFAEGWYATKCGKLGGKWENETCYIEGIFE